MVSEGDLPSGTDEYTEDICVTANACLTLHIYDDYGDGMCCDYGEGHVEVLSAAGEMLAYNDGQFSYEAVESFCVGDGGCQLATEISVQYASGEGVSDGILFIDTFSEEDTYAYSIDGGQTFQSIHIFGNLAPGVYDVVVEYASGLCSYEETVVVSVCNEDDLQLAVTHPGSVLTTDGAIVITALSGASNYTYSIDGGQTFFETGDFQGLPVGDYNVVVLSTSGICEYEFDVPLVVGGLEEDFQGADLAGSLRLSPTRPRTASRWTSPRPAAGGASRGDPRPPAGQSTP